MHYKIGDTCVYNEHGFCNSVVLKHDTLIHLFHNSIVCVMNSRVSGQCLYTIHSTLSINTYIIYKQKVHVIMRVQFLAQGKNERLWWGSNSRLIKHINQHNIKMSAYDYGKIAWFYFCAPIATYGGTRLRKADL